MAVDPNGLQGMFGSGDISTALTNLRRTIQQNL